MSNVLKKKQPGIIQVLYLHNISEISGGERSLLNLWENLDRNKFKPYLIIPQKGLLDQEAEKLGVQTFFLKVPQLRPRNLFLILSVVFKLGQFVKENNIDILHSCTPRNNILSSIVGKFLGIPVVWHERNLICDLTVEKEIDRTRQFLFLPDRVICNSKAVAQRFYKHTGIPSKVAPILNGVNLNRFNPLPDSLEIKNKLGIKNQKIVGLVSNLNERKRVEYFIEAASCISKKNANVKFIIVGGEFPDRGGRRLKELKKMAEHLGLKNHFIFTDFRNNVNDFLSLFDVFAHVTQKEACSRAIIEAMAAGKPVVAINDGGNPELVEDGVTGILKEPDDLEGFAEAIVELLNDDAKRIEMGKNGRTRVEEFFDVKRNARQTEEIYLELISFEISGMPRLKDN